MSLLGVARMATDRAGKHNFSVIKAGVRELMCTTFKPLPKEIA